MVDDWADWDLDSIPTGTRASQESAAEIRERQRWNDEVIAERIRLAADDPIGELLDAAYPIAPPVRDYELLSEGTDSEPGELLADGLMPPDGATVLYGPGGVGKGHLACEAIRHITAVGRVLIADYESHRSEWRKRLRMMLPDTEWGKIAYTIPEAQLPKAAPRIRDIAREFGATAVVIDSYQAATPDGRVHAEQADTPRDMFRALSVIGVPSLVLAHVTKSGGDHQPYPYGSVFVHNYARMSWSMSKLSEDGEPLTVEIRNQKANDLEKQLPRRYTFVYARDRLLVSREVLLSRADAIVAVLSGQKDWLMPAAIWSLMAQQGLLPEGMTVHHVGALLRNDKGGRFLHAAQGWKTARG